MRVLLLGPNRPSLSVFFESRGDSVLCYDGRITVDMAIVKEADWLISYGYRFLICREVLEKFGQQAINLHISYLPWNRGADPNIWSFLENTPKGVTIHRLGHEIDNGEIIAQKEVVFVNEQETLRSSYEKLTKEIEELFCCVWDSLLKGLIKSRRQEPGGSFHKSKDKDQYLPLLLQGWDTPVGYLIGKAL